MAWYRLMLLLTLALNIHSQDSPCDRGGHRRIPNEGLRYVNFKITPDDTPFHDSRLLEDWYYVGNDPMPEYAPSLFACGTIYPVWLNGVHPADENELDAQACLKDVGNDCIKTFKIKILKCPEQFYLYYLVPTETAEEGYCFGEGIAGETPDYIAPAPTVTTSTTDGTIQDGNDEYPVSKTIFECLFEESTTDHLFYEISWLREGDVWYTTSSETTSGHVNHRLTEEIFSSKGFSLGQHISCTVRAYTVPKGPPGKLSDKAVDFFAGIQIHTPTLSFKRGGNDITKRTIRLQPTVPIGCKYVNQCHIGLTTYTPPESVRGKCGGIIMEKSTCGINIESETYSDVYEISVDAAETGQYQNTDGVYEIFFKTDKTSHNLIWGGYSLPPIQVTVFKPDSINRGYEGKRCSARSDPHMTTFDGRSYDNHQAGVFILYRHTEYDTEIQIEHERCNSRWGIEIRCVCGVSVRAGRDLYRLSVCKRQLSVAFIKCDDGVLEVKSINEKHYRIFLPYGTYVDATIREVSNPSTTDGDKTLELFVQPSSFDDRGRARGLCGLMGDGCTNDFHDRAGNTGNMDNGFCNNRLSWSNQPTNFIKNWKVTDDTANMFHALFDFKKINTWPFHVCVCEICDETNPCNDLTGSVPCKKSAVAVCSKGKAVGKSTCDTQMRSRRSIRRGPGIPVVKLPTYSTDDQRIKRDVPSQNWTEEAALEFCESFMNTSPVYSLCEEVPSVNPLESLEDCVMDIMISEGTDWASTNMQNMQGPCLSELSRNVTLRETEDETPSIAEIIEKLACPGNCSSKGTCIEGVCECDKGLGGADCSMDMSRGPIISGLLDEGLCDERELRCDQAFVFGHVFIDSSNLTCRLHAFVINYAGERTLYAAHFIPGEFETLIEVICPIEPESEQQIVARNRVRTNGGFVHGYTVSVSNDGVVYEEGRDLFIYDSECQIPYMVKNETHFSLKEQFCFIDGSCVSHGTQHPNVTCQICDSGRTTETWSNNDADPECRESGGEITTPGGDTPDGGGGGRSVASLASLPDVVWAILLAFYILMQRL